MEGQIRLAVVLLLPIIPLVALLTLFWRDPLDIEKQDGVSVQAYITNISNPSSRYQGHYPGLRVRAQSEEGIFGTTTVIPSDIAGCEVGDAIKAEQVGLKLYLEPEPCE